VCAFHRDNHRFETPSALTQSADRKRPDVHRQTLSDVSIDAPASRLNRERRTGGANPLVAAGRGSIRRVDAGNLAGGSMIET
jgi:hypothetical protein